MPIFTVLDIKIINAYTLRSEAFKGSKIHFSSNIADSASALRGIWFLRVRNSSTHVVLRNSVNSHGQNPKVVSVLVLGRGETISILEPEHCFPRSPVMAFSRVVRIFL